MLGENLSVKRPELLRILLSRVAPGPLVKGCSNARLRRFEAISRNVLENGDHLKDIEAAIEAAGLYRLRYEQPEGCHVYRIRFLGDLPREYVGYTCGPIWDRLAGHFGVREPRKWGKARYPIQYFASPDVIEKESIGTGTRRIRELAAKEREYRFHCLESGLSDAEAIQKEKILISRLRRPLNEHHVRA